MITKWKLSNFKSIRTQTELSMGPLTIFAGPNSSGKSTFIQSILLINQTLTSQVRSRSVILNGPLTKLGQFHDLRSFGKRKTNRIRIEWECQLPVDNQGGNAVTPTPVTQRGVFYGRRGIRLEQVSFSMSFGPDPTDNQRELTQLQPTLFGCTISCVAKTRDGSSLQGRLAIRRAGTEKVQKLHVPQLLRRNMDEDARAAARLIHLELTAGKHVIQLAKVVSAFDALIEGGRMIEEGLNVPRQEVPSIPDVEELMEKEADMPVGEAAKILANFFDMDVEGQARLMLILGLEDL